MTDEHHTEKPRTLPILPLLIAIVLTLAAVSFTAARLIQPAADHPTTPPTPTAPTPTTPPASTATRPRPMLFLNADTWVSWAVADLDTGDITTNGQPGTGITASVIKVGIAADYLAGAEQAHHEPTRTELDRITRMIRDSDNTAAEQLYEARGGRAVIGRLITTCGLTHTTAGRTWGTTTTNAADLAALGGCVGVGLLTTARWTTWLLDQMRNIRGDGAFGITTRRATADGVPVAYKNGWLLVDGRWHVNCLAVAAGWTLAVMVTYPAGYGLAYGADVCAQLAAAAPDDAEKAPTRAM